MGEKGYNRGNLRREALAAAGARGIVMKRLCVFDLDGTLVNSLGDLADSANFALEKRGFPTHPRELYRYFVGGGIPKLIRRILPQGTSEEEIREVHDLFAREYEIRCLDTTAPYPGILDLLEELEKREVGAAVFSNKDHGFAARIVEALFPGQRFAFVQGMGQGMPKKPDPAGMLPHLADLGISPGECLYLGDSGVDMRTANNAGCLAIGVLWGFREREELLENGAAQLICWPLEALDYLD